MTQKVVRHLLLERILEGRVSAGDTVCMTFAAEWFLFQRVGSGVAEAA
ncbi:MAG: hypothetical protein AAGB11_01390 [Pseudomonadota bacterium]